MEVTGIINLVIIGFCLIFNIYNNASNLPPYINEFFANYNSRHKERGKLILKEGYNSKNELNYRENHIYNYNKELASFKTASLAYSYHYLESTYVENYPLERVEKLTYTKNKDKIIESLSYSYNRLGQIVKMDKSTSKGGNISILNQYICDLPDLQKEAIHIKMQMKNVIQKPIRIIEKKSNGKVISGIYFKYYENDGLYLLKETQRLKAIPSLSIKDFLFDNYLYTDIAYSHDKLGNIIQSIDRKSRINTYVWGKTNLLAVIGGLGYEEVSKIEGLSNIKASLALERLSDAQIEALYKLKDGLVNVYEYKPLIGISKIIDPAQSINDFIYDDQGRLIKEIDGTYRIPTILREYKYNYSNYPIDVYRKR